MIKNRKNKRTAKNGVYTINVKESDDVVRAIKELENREINVTPILSFEKRAELVRLIASFVFMNEGKSIDDYTPEYLELSRRINIVSYYTDFELPKNINDAWIVLSCTSLYDEVVARIRDDIELIFDEADILIKTRKRYLENKTDINKLFENISNKIGSLGTQFTKEDIGNVLKLVETLPNYSQENIIKAIVDMDKDSKK